MSVCVGLVGKIELKKKIKDKIGSALHFEGRFLHGLEAKNKPL